MKYISHKAKLVITSTLSVIFSSVVIVLLETTRLGL